MGTVEAWAASAAGGVVLLVLIYVVLLSRAIHNEQVISSTVAAMLAALDGEPAPQRALLSAVADTLILQERAAARIEMAVHEMALHAHRFARPTQRPEQLLKELLKLPEPQLLIADFLEQHGGGPGSHAAFSSIAGGLLCEATTEVFGDLADAGLVQMEKLMLLAEEGGIAAVALAGLAAPAHPGPQSYLAPRVADLDSAAMAAIAKQLDWTTRRQLRLATLLHGQAEAMLRIRRNGKHGPAVVWSRARQLVRLPRMRKPEFRPDDLAILGLAFDAAGEVIDIAAERLADGEPTQAAHLLAGLRLPVPAGLPGRMYNQESLAQARPLAAFGVWHRLAVSRWAASALSAAVQAQSEPSASDGSSTAPPDRNTGDEDTVPCDEHSRAAG